MAFLKKQHKKKQLESKSGYLIMFNSKLVVKKSPQGLGDSPVDRVS